MSKAVLLSIQPKWCELIAIGKKTVEVRKTKPKLPTPFKCYIYCTKDRKEIFWDSHALMNPYKYIDDHSHNMWDKRLNGKVIGEFMCDKIFPMSITYSDPNSRIALKEFPYTCLTDKQIMDYLGNGNTGFGWHISDLKIYDNPKALDEFYSHCNRSGNADDRICKSCPNFYFDQNPISGYTRWCGTYKRKHLTHAPQSWCYVECLENAQCANILMYRR